MSTTERTTTVPDKAAKRELILDAAIRCFAVSGFAATEVETICQAAGVAKGTIYRYFASKDELFRAATELALQRMAEHVFESFARLDDPVAILRTSFHALAWYAQKHPEVLELMAQERAALRQHVPSLHLFHRDAHRPFFESIVQRAVDEGQLKPVDPATFVRTTTYLMYGLIFAARIEGEQGQLVAHADAAIDLLLAGLVRNER